MPEGVGYGPQTVGSPGLTLNYIGNHANATSGVIAVGSAGVGSYSTLLDFSTGNLYIVSEFQFFRGYTAAAANDYVWRISLNGNVIMEFYDTAGDRMEYPIHLIIPPFSEIEVTAANISTTTDTNLTAIMTGRVYK